MSDKTTETPAPSPLEAARAKLKAVQDANQAALDAAGEKRELVRLEEEARFEEALGRAYADPKLGAERVIGGEIEGAGFAILKLPDPITWQHFQDRGILKKDGLSTGLCDDLVTRCIYYPDLQTFRQMLDRNPAASVKLTSLLTDAMSPEDMAMGKGSRSLRRRR